MSKKQIPSGRELFIVHNRDQACKGECYARDRADKSNTLDISTVLLEIGDIPALDV